MEYKEKGIIKRVGFIDGEIIIARSNDSNYLINGLSINNINYFPVQVDSCIKTAFICDVFIENIQYLNNQSLKPDIISEWYLCSMPEVLFANRTSRYDKHPRYKIRDGMDLPIKNEEDYLRTGYSSSWDYVKIMYNDYIIVVQAVPKKYLPSEIDGIAIEYRITNEGFPTDNFRKIFQEYISFILGSHIQKIGISEYKLGYELLSCVSQNPWKRRNKKNGNINPIPLKNGLDRNFFEKKLNELLRNFVTLYEKVSLSDCLWKLWIGSDLPIGTNLPIIASGFEMLINSYLENKTLLKKYSKKEKRDYNNLIKDEIESLSFKLASYDFGPFVLNKLKNPYNYGIGEKISLFFKNISINFKSDSLEAKALKERNLMIHNGMNFITIEEQRRIKKISDAYVTLINRVILKLLDYKSFYVDYSKEGVRYLKMNQNL